MKHQNKERFLHILLNTFSVELMYNFMQCHLQVCITHSLKNTETRRKYFFHFKIVQLFNGKSTHYIIITNGNGSQENHIFEIRNLIYIDSIQIKSLSTSLSRQVVYNARPSNQARMSRFVCHMKQQLRVIITTQSVTILFFRSWSEGD